MTFASALYRLAISLWVGGIALFTFIVTPVVFRTQGRDAAGRIVGAMFPGYFKYVLGLVGAALLARILSGESSHGWRQWFGTLLIVSALLLAGYQAFGLAPRMKEVKRSVASYETALAEDPARKEFSRLHGISMVVNLTVLLEGAALVLAYDFFRR